MVNPHERFSLNPVRRQLGRDHPHVKLRDGTEAGPLSFYFNPTRATFDLKHGATFPLAETSGTDGEPLPDGARIAWRARDNRKGTLRTLASRSAHLAALHGCFILQCSV